MKFHLGFELDALSSMSDALPLRHCTNIQKLITARTKDCSTMHTTS